MKRGDSILQQQTADISLAQEQLAVTSNLPFDTIELTAMNAQTAFSLKAIEFETVNIPIGQTTQLTFYQDKLITKVFEDGYLVEEIAREKNQPVSDSLDRISIEALDSDDEIRVEEDEILVDKEDGLGIADGDDGHNQDDDCDDDEENCEEKEDDDDDDCEKEDDDDDEEDDDDCSLKKRIDGDEILILTLNPTTYYSRATQVLVTVDKVKSIKRNRSGGTIKLIASSQDNEVANMVFNLTKSQGQLIFSSDLPFDRLAIMAGDEDTQFTFRVAQFTTF